MTELVEMERSLRLAAEENYRNLLRKDNAAIESHPRMKQLLEIEKAAEELAAALRVVGCHPDAEVMAQNALKTYAAAKENRG